MTIRKVLVPAIAALLFVGAGCASSAPYSEKPSDQAESSASAPAAGDSSVLTTSVQLDDSWKSYVNQALSFEFKWPTKGRYAPQWAVTFVSEGDARIKDGCIVEGEESKRVKVGEAEFCHSWTDGASGPKDWYATKHDSRYAVISFTKLERAEGFSLDEYRANLDQIISTYKSTK